MHPAIVPIAVLSSTFHNDWGNEGDSGRLNTASRGETGTFAVYRELEFLSRKLDMQAVPARRVIPAAGTVRYFDSGIARAAGDPRPGFTLAEHVLWFGRRSVDAAARAGDCFEELARLYAVLSDPQIAEQIQGNNVFQRSHLRLIPSCVSVEYRRLEVAERLGSKLLIQTIDNGLLRVRGSMAPSASFFGWAPSVRRPISEFLRSQRDNLFAQEGSAAAERVRSGQFERFLRSLAPEDNTLKNRTTIPEDERGGYDATDDDWRQLVNRMCADFQRQCDELTKSAAKKIDETVSGEFSAAQLWLREEVIEQQVNSPDAGLRVAAQSLQSVREEFRRVAQLFKRQWTDVIRPVPGGRLQSPGQEEGRLKAAIARLDPQIGEVAVRQGFPTPVAALLALGVGALLGAGTWMLDVGAGAAIAVSVAAAFFTWLFVGRAPGAQGQSKAQLRREAVARMLEAYEDLLLARRADHAWRTIRERFINALISPDDEMNQTGEQRSETGKLAQSLSDLGTLLEDVRDSIRGRLQALEHRPPSVVAEVGSELEIPATWVSELQNQVRAGIRFLVSKETSQPRITVAVSDQGQSRRFRLDEVLAREASPEKSARYAELLQHSANVAQAVIAQAAVADASVLPTSFTEVVTDSYDMAQLLTELGKKANARGPACNVEDGIAAPTVSRLVVGSAKLQALVGEAVNGHLRNSEQPEHRRILQALQESADGAPQVSERVGESVLLFDIWEFGATQRLEDFKRAQSYYYSFGHPVDEGALPERFCAGNFEFHIIPELSTAAYIEFMQHLRLPLEQPLLQRLRGCDPRLPGPTALDLFYIARARGLLEELNQHVWLRTSHCGKSTCGDVLLLSTHMYSPGADDPFGSGRAVINQFDALADFLACQPGVADTAVATTLNGVGAGIEFQTWAALGPQRVRAIKDCLGEHFYAVRGDSAKTRELYEHCFSLASKDAEGMSERIGGQWLAICRTVFDQAVNKLGT